MRFIKLTYDGTYSHKLGAPEYVDSRRIALIESRTGIEGSYVYIDCGNQYVLSVKEKPEEIIAMINDGDFCMYSKEFPSDDSEFIFSRGEQGVE